MLDHEIDERPGEREQTPNRVVTTVLTGVLFQRLLQSAGKVLDNDDGGQFHGVL